MEETGTPNPKKITKWVSEASPNKTSTPIRIENKNQFAPQGSDPKELKNHQKQIKQDRFEDRVTAGYQSKLLENIHDAEEEGGPQENGHHKEIQTNGSYSLLNDQYITGGQSSIVYGAASKGIIKRDQQNNAVVYKTYYAAANPFQQMDPNDLEKYKKEVAQKQMKEQEKSSKTSINEKINKSEIIATDLNGSKKKSNTIPRSKSLLDKKHEKLTENLKCTSGGSQASSPQSSRESSPTRSPKSNSTTGINGSKNGHATSPQSEKSVNKSSTIPANYPNEKPAEKPKKKSKLSFLSRKKKEPVMQVSQ